MTRAAAAVLAAAVLLGGCVATRQAPPLPAGTAPSAPSAPIAPAAAPTVALSGHLVQGGLAYGQVSPGTLSLVLDGQPVRIAPDGRFIVGFGRDAAAQAVLEARGAGGAVTRRTLAIAARQWDIQSLPTLPRGTAPTPEFQRRRTAELAQINAARAKETGAQGWRGPFRWPVTGRISGVFGSQRIYAGEPGAFHAGVDIARPTGTPVAAPADGVVILAAAAPFTLEGNLLMIDHGMGLNSAFLHLSRIDVRPGDHVVAGQIVGAIGMTGRATGPHLHWAMKWQDVRIDAQLLAGAMAEER